MKFHRLLPVTSLCLIGLVLGSEVLRVLIGSREDARRVRMVEVNRLQQEVARLEALQSSAGLADYVAEAQTWRPEASRLEGDWEVRWLRLQQEWRAQLADHYAVGSAELEWGIPSNRDRTVREVWLAQASVLYPRIWKALPQIPEVNCVVESTGSDGVRLLTWDVRFEGESPDLGRLESSLRESPLKVVVTTLEVVPVGPEKGLLQAGKSRFAVRFVTLPPEVYR